MTPKFENRGAPHQYSLRWGPWQLNNVLNLAGLESVSLRHTKGADGLSIPLFFDISPFCFVGFGQGDPPDGVVHDINHGWIYVNHTNEPRIGTSCSA